MAHTKKLTVLTAMLSIFTAVSLTSCGEDLPTSVIAVPEDITKNVIGHKWLLESEGEGESETFVPTNLRKVITFESETKAFISETVDGIWLPKAEYALEINGMNLTLKSTSKEINPSRTLEYEVSFAAVSTLHLIDLSQDLKLSFSKYDVDYTETIIGLWEGKSTSETSEISQNDDGETHRWNYKHDGTYIFMKRIMMCGVLFQAPTANTL